jgi:hypothetical protein
MTTDQALQELQTIRRLFARIYDGGLSGEELMPVLTTSAKKIRTLESFLQGLSTEYRSQSVHSILPNELDAH